MSVFSSTSARVIFRPVGNPAFTVTSAMPSSRRSESATPAKPLTPSRDATSATRLRSLPAVTRSSVARPASAPPPALRLTKDSFEEMPKTRASPRTSNPCRLTAMLNRASRASAPSGRPVKTPFAMVPVTSNSMASGCSLRRIGKRVLTVSSACPEALIFVRSMPLPLAMPRRVATRMALPTSPDSFRSVLPRAGLPPITGLMPILPVDRSRPSTRPSVRMISPRFSAMVSLPSRSVKAGIFRPSSRRASLSVINPSRSVIRGRSPSSRIRAVSLRSSTLPCGILLPTQLRVLLIIHSGQMA